MVRSDGATEAMALYGATVSYYEQLRVGEGTGKPLFDDLCYQARWIGFDGTAGELGPETCFTVSYPKVSQCAVMSAPAGLTALLAFAIAAFALILLLVVIVNFFRVWVRYVEECLE